MTVKWLDRGIGFCQPYALCLTVADFHSELRKFGFENLPAFSLTGATTHFFKSQTDQEIALVCVKDFTGKDPIYIAALLMHEAVHIWQSYCKYIGEQSPGDEIEAYAIQWIAQELMFSFREQTCKKANKK
jgi:hypothetical protein